MNSKTKCLVCGHFLTTEEYEDGNSRICDKCWKCPKCGVGVTTENGRDGIIIEEDDTIICHPCDMAWGFRRFENILVKKANLVTCPTCKGKGTVSGKKG
jgi:hypothetical protein